MLIKGNYKHIFLKTKYFNKSYTQDLKLKVVTPFFLDVNLDTPPKGAIIVEIYQLPTGANVKIYMDAKGTHYIYVLEIPESKVLMKDLPKIYDNLEYFRETGETSDDYIKRWYEGHGILEHLLLDERILEVNINPPAFKTSMRIVHADYQECTSNILATDEFLNFLLTRLKMNTGRPLNKVQPQIDGEINVGGVNARVAGIINPFSVFGTGFSIRKHRERPWTLPLFIQNKSINALFAGFMSLVISHGRAFITAGPRGSGKTSLLGSLMLEILQRYRIITIEDTQELPVYDYKKLGYDILPLKVRSALADESLEIPFDKGLRTSLRLGDSALIVGEVRSVEAKILYEAMRVGAMSNVVAGTIHADDAYGVYDRVVNDLGVPKGSFKSTDIIIIQNLIKDPSGVGRKRRVIQVTEVLKDWEDEPKFTDLFLYNPKTDQLEPTKDLLGGNSITLKNILARTEGYRDYGSVLQDMNLRAWAKEEIVKQSKGDDSLLEANYSSNSNNLFMLLVKNIKPFESEKNLKMFKEEFSKGLVKILKKEEK
jgi:archaeal flagellar protein FlaI